MQCWLRGVGLLGTRCGDRHAPETRDMSKTGPGTSSLKRWLVMSSEPVRMYAAAGSQASSGQSQMPHFRALLFLGTFSSLTTDAGLLGLPSSCQDCFTSSELSSLVPSKISHVPASFLLKVSNWSHDDDAQQGQGKASQRTEAPHLLVKTSQRAKAPQLLEDC